MKKVIERAATNWNSKTPMWAKGLQWLLGGVSSSVAALFLFWDTIPQEIKAGFTPTELKSVAICGALAIVGLKFFKK